MRHNSQGFKKIPTAVGTRLPTAKEVVVEASIVLDDDYTYDYDETVQYYTGIAVLLFAGLGSAIYIAYGLWDKSPGPGYSIIWAGIYFTIAWFAVHKYFIGAAWKKHVENRLDSNVEKQVGCWARSLMWWNLSCAIAHVGLSIALFFLIGDTWPVRASLNHFEWKPVNASETRACSDNNVTCQVSVETTMVGKLYAEWIVFSFHMLSGVAHCVVYWEMVEKKCVVVPTLTPRIGSLYINALRNKMNPLRWFEYFFSASLMQVVIMLLTGYTDVWILALSASSIAITQVFGYASEVQVSQTTRFNLAFSEFKLAPFVAADIVVLIVVASIISGLPTLRNVLIIVIVLEFIYLVYAAREGLKWEPEKWFYYMCGWVSFSVPWIAVYYSFYDSISRSSTGPPDWVRVVVWSLVLLFASFAVVMGWYLYHSKDTFVSFYAENAYLMLSLVSKASLAFQLWYGLDQRSGRGLVPPDPTCNCTLRNLIKNITAGT